MALIMASIHKQSASDKLAKVKKELEETKNALQSEKKRLEAKIAELEKKLASPFAALIEQATATALIAKAKLTTVVTELQAGKWDSANKLFLDTLSSISSSLTQLQSFIGKELEEHLPALKKAIQEGLSQSGKVYDSQIKGRLGEVGKLLSRVNDELKALIKSKARQFPVLKPLEDPVNLQLFVYAILVAPLFLLLLPFLLYFAFALSPDSSSKSKSSSGGKGSGGKPKGNKPNKKK